MHYKVYSQVNTVYIAWPKTEVRSLCIIIISLIIITSLYILRRNKAEK